MENLKVTSTAYPDGAVVSYDKGMVPVNPKIMSRVMVEAVAQHIVRPRTARTTKRLR